LKFCVHILRTHFFYCPFLLSFLKPIMVKIRKQNKIGNLHAYAVYYHAVESTIYCLCIKFVVSCHRNLNFTWLCFFIKPIYMIFTGNREEIWIFGPGLKLCKKSKKGQNLKFCEKVEIFHFFFFRQVTLFPPFYPLCSSSKEITINFFSDLFILIWFSESTLPLFKPCFLKYYNFRQN
jgi:hypothetical protein